MIKTHSKIIEIFDIEGLEKVPERIKDVILSFQDDAENMKTPKDNFFISFSLIFTDSDDDYDLVNTDLALFMSEDGYAPELYVIFFGNSKSNGSPYGKIEYKVRVDDMQLSIPSKGIKPVGMVDRHETYVGSNYALEDFYDTWIKPDMEAFVEHIKEQYEENQAEER